MSGQAAQQALFGRQEPLPTPRTHRHTTNDLDLVAAVVRLAADPGYVLIGPSERVYRRDPTTKGAVEAVPAYEQEAVTQLLASGHLSIGGTHRVHHGGREGAASSVLVPKTTRAMVRRWAALQPIHGPTGHHSTPRAPHDTASPTTTTTEARRPR